MQEENINREQITRKNEYWVGLDLKYRAQVRKTRSIVLEKGKGVEVWDVEGKKYLDFESGQIGSKLSCSCKIV
jgi:4-aminobutyrate aminotransferase-like enzyme